MATIRTSSFCGLSRSSDWQNWLKENAPDLHQDLLSVVGAVKGCRANSNKMMDIYFELNRRGMESQLITFLKRRFPWMVKDTPVPSPQQKAQIRTTTTSHHVQSTQKSKDWNTLNKHKVFELYRPDILAFPQKFIIVDHPSNLHDRVSQFIRNKLGIDYIIVDDRAYIEYFDTKYAAVIDKIPRETRDIYKYRLKMQQDAQ